MDALRGSLSRVSRWDGRVEAECLYRCLFPPRSASLCFPSGLPPEARERRAMLLLPYHTSSVSQIEASNNLESAIR